MKFLKKAKKSLGQNFLIDNNIINKIINIGSINKNKTIIEIGAGYGNLTKAIVSAGPKKILAIEKDKKLALLLKNKFKNYDNIKIINRDVLNIIEEDNLEQNIIVFGNLPYNVSTKILASLILLKKWPPWYEILILMFQKEVAERIIAKTQTREFSRLSVLSNWRLEIKKHFNVSNNCFFPKPKITSTVLSFIPKKNNVFNIVKNMTRPMKNMTRPMWPMWTVNVSVILSILSILIVIPVLLNVSNFHETHFHENSGFSHDNINGFSDFYDGFLPRSNDGFLKSGLSIQKFGHDSSSSSSFGGGGKTPLVAVVASPLRDMHPPAALLVAWHHSRLPHRNLSTIILLSHPAASMVQSGTMVFSMLDPQYWTPFAKPASKKF